MVKIVAIVALIVVGLVMIAMHFKSPTGVEASFAHLWNDGGWFPKGISGFLPVSRLQCSLSWALSWLVLPPQKLKIRKIAAARD
ncbi:D-serine/D-alanine/glycine transporter [Salmonella enterica subsp. enterica]|uniref:D-serine/D-alanine/glycine transporter n=1 Tax=Salmonella enterica I TaxID=59201 RepID=A0A379WGY0_SALET|nr:D-serine/D-alanine/glycine transporter [Salmonella enterica subsp. enterica]